MVRIVLVGCLSLLTVVARADVGGEMKNFWDSLGGMANVTGASSYHGQQSGYYTFGNLYSRAPSVNAQIATLSLPSFRAGCGGIDLYTGAFSFINASQLINLAKAIISNAGGFAFELAMQTIAPQIAEKMDELRALAEQINRMNINSCEAAQSLVGGLWPKSDRASAAMCESIGTSQGLFSDYAAAKFACGTGGKRTETLHSATGALADQVTVDRNFTWDAISKSFPSTDSSLRFFVMSIAGTSIVKLGTSDSSSAQYRVLEPIALSGDLLKALMDGGHFTGYSCNLTTDPKCLDPHTSAIDISVGFEKRVADMLIAMVGKIASNETLSSDEQVFLNVATLPIYKMLTVYTAYNPNVARDILPQYAEYIAMGIVYSFLHHQLEQLKQGGSYLATGGEEQERWVQKIDHNLSVLHREQQLHAQDYQNVLAIVNQTRVLERSFLQAKIEAHHG